MADVVSPLWGQSMRIVVSTSATAASINVANANAVYVANRTANSEISFRLSASSVTATAADFRIVGDCPVVIPIPADGTWTKLNAIASSATVLVVNPIQYTVGQG